MTTTVTDDLTALLGRRFAAVLFDLDGTLVDSTAVVDRCWRQWAAEFELTGFEVVHGIPARQVIAEWLPEQQREGAFARIEQLEAADVDGVRVLPGALAALTAVGPDRSAIVTSGTRPLMRARVAATGLPMPQVVVTPEDTERGKPYPDPYLAAARKLGVDPGDCLVVEDAAAGLRAGRAAGCQTLALLGTPGEPVAGVLAAAPDAIATSLAAVTFRRDGERIEVGPAGESIGSPYEQA